MVGDAVRLGLRTPLAVRVGVRVGGDTVSVKLGVKDGLLGGDAVWVGAEREGEQEQEQEGLGVGGVGVAVGVLQLKLREGLGEGLSGKVAVAEDCVAVGVGVGLAEPGDRDAETEDSEAVALAGLPDGLTEGGLWDAEVTVGVRVLWDSVPDTDAEEESVAVGVSAAMWRGRAGEGI